MAIIRITNEEELQKAKEREHEIYEKQQMDECAEELNQLIIAIEVYEKRNENSGSNETAQ